MYPLRNIRDRLFCYDMVRAISFYYTFSTGTWMMESHSSGFS